MQSKEKNNIIFLRLFSDENVNEQLQIVCMKHKIKTAVVISGIGQLLQAKIGYFKEKENYSVTTFNKPVEILSITGNIFKDVDDYNSHLHIVLGDEEKNAIGGHFIDGKVSVTAEFVILKTEIKIFRRYDEKTGLKALFLE